MSAMGSFESCWRPVAREWLHQLLLQNAWLMCQCSSVRSGVRTCTFACAGCWQSCQSTIEVLTKCGTMPVNDAAQQRIQKLNSLRHPNVLKVLSARQRTSLLNHHCHGGNALPECAPQAWLVQERCNGGTLAAALHAGAFACPQAQLPKPLMPVMMIVLDVMRALAAMHAADTAFGAPLAKAVELQVKSC